MWVTTSTEFLARTPELRLLCRACIRKAPA
jgi:hypothetical protein